MSDDPPPPVATSVTVALTVDVDPSTPGADPIDGDRWARLLSAALAAEGVPAGAEAGLSFVTADAMATLNADHMGAHGPTDVLAFPIDGADASGGGDGPAGLVGDVVVCPAVAAANAKDHAGTVDDEIALLVVHGALHLLGHDHAEPGERAAMQAAERRLLDAHHGPLARDPWREGDR